MFDLTRRKLIASSAALVGAAASTRRASAAESQPPALFGTVTDGRVDLPPVHGPSDLEGTVPNPEPPEKRLGIAVVGLGHLALEEILPAFGATKHVRLAALVSGEADKARAIAREYGIGEAHVYDYTTYDRLKNDASVDIVYIVLPNALHEEYVVRAAAAGKHVLCEKPMATSVGACERMIAAVRAAGRKLQIAYRLQYEPTHRAAIAMAREKRFGELRYIEAVNGQNDLPNGQWRQIRSLSGGGSLPDVGLYCLNAFRYITGEEPIEITGRTTQPQGDPRFREIEDISQFTFRFPSGVFASGAAGYSFHESRRLRVHAESGWFGLDPAFAYDGLVLETGRKIDASNGVEHRRFAAKSQFATEMDAFADAIANDRTPLTPGEEGLQDQRIMAAIYQSAADGGRVIKLAPSSGLDRTRGPVPTTATGS